MLLDPPSDLSPHVVASTVILAGLLCAGVFARIFLYANRPTNGLSSVHTELDNRERATKWLLNAGAVLDEGYRKVRREQYERRTGRLKRFLVNAVPRQILGCTYSRR